MEKAKRFNGDSLVLHKLHSLRICLRNISPEKAA